MQVTELTGVGGCGGRYESMLPAGLGRLTALAAATDMQGAHRIRMQHATGAGMGFFEGRKK